MRSVLPTVFVVEFFPCFFGIDHLTIYSDISIQKNKFSMMSTHTLTLAYIRSCISQLDARIKSLKRLSFCLFCMGVEFLSFFCITEQYGILSIDNLKNSFNLCIWKISTKKIFNRSCVRRENIFGIFLTSFRISNRIDICQSARVLLK